MKKTFKYIMAIAAVLAFASCEKAPSKAEVEAGFAPKGEIPTVTKPVVGEVVPVEKRADITVTFAGYTAETDSLELGFLVSTDPTFTSSKAVLLDPANIPADGTVTVSLPVTIATKNYIRATASSVSGTNLSEIVEIDVPAIPWYQAMAASYSGDAYSYWDEDGCSWPGHTISVAADGDAKTVTFTDFDAFAVANGFPSVITGTYDETTRTVSIPTNEGVFDVGLSGAGIVGVAMDDEFESSSTFSIRFSSDFTQMTVQPYGCNSASGWYEIYFQTTYAAD